MEPIEHITEHFKKHPSINEIKKFDSTKEANRLFTFPQTCKEIN